LTCAVRLEYRGPVSTFGIRFHPARGAAFLGQAATFLTDKILLLAQVSSQIDSSFASVLTADWNPEVDSCRAAVDRILLDQLAVSTAADLPIAAVVDRLAGLDFLPSITEMAIELGISSRQLQRRFLASVGLPPKQFVRVLRFVRMWQVASMRRPETWAALAAEHGYADQAHMVREFRAFGVEPPTHFFSQDWYEATELSRVSGPAEGVRAGQDVRSVQDPPGKSRL
jgi:AraC-like DNA-binding protein